MKQQHTDDAQKQITLQQIYKIIDTTCGIILNFCHYSPELLRHFKQANLL